MSDVRSVYLIISVSLDGALLGPGDDVGRHPVLDRVAHPVLVLHQASALLEGEEVAALPPLALPLAVQGVLRLRGLPDLVAAQIQTALEAVHAADHLGGGGRKEEKKNTRTDSVQRPAATIGLGIPTNC